MTSYSKFFDEHIRSRTCQNFLHPESCTEHLTKDIPLFFISNLKYFLPVCFLPLLVHLRSLNKKRITKVLKHYLNCTISGFLVGISINALICIFRKICGRFGYYTFTFVPGVLGAYLTFLASNRVVKLFENSIFQSTLNVYLLKRSNFITRTITDSRLMQTLIFMLCSAIILHGKQIFKNEQFWILTPNPKLPPHDNTLVEKCGLHEQSTCKQYLLQGMRNYFTFGLILDTIKMVMSERVTSHEQSSKMIGKLRNFRIRSTAFLTFYIGIYRFLHCWLNRKSLYSDDWNHILSSFFAGSCYYLHPQPTIFSYSLIQAIRNLWSTFEFLNHDSKNKIIKRLLKIPYAKLLHPFAQGILIHSCTSQPQYLSPFAHTVCNGVTNSYAKHVRKQIEKVMKQHNFKEV